MNLFYLPMIILFLVINLAFIFTFGFFIGVEKIDKFLHEVILGFIKNNKYAKSVVFISNIIIWVLLIYFFKDGIKEQFYKLLNKGI